MSDLESPPREYVACEAFSPAQVEAIRLHLADICRSPAFRKSERCSQFLQFVVQRAIEGKPEDLKERCIGIEVFGRSAGYETSGDAIVRVKAGEVRRRLAQYYRDNGEAVSLRIELSSGSYIPKFHWTAETHPLPEETARTVSVLLPGANARTVRRILPFLVLGMIAAVALAIGLQPHLTAFDQFWKPAIETDGLPTICFGRSGSHIYVLSDRLRENLARLGPAHAESGPLPLPIKAGDIADIPNFHISVGNLYAIVGIEEVLNAHGRKVHVVSDEELKLGDLHDRTIIFIGAFSNPWTLSRNSGMRFEFHTASATGPKSIRDRQHPERKWEVPGRGYPWAPQTVDYAIASRTFDRANNSVVITAAGINAFGTQAAGEFLSNANYWKDLAATLPRGWERRNLQFVLETAVVGITPSPPKVVATHVWE